MSVILRFPKERLASFVVSFGAASIGRYSVIGTKGTLTLDPCYEYAADMRMKVTIDGNSNERIFPRTDQFGPEVQYFSNCILEGREPEPSGEEGLRDVQIVRAIYRAAETGRAVQVESASAPKRPGLGQEIRKPPVQAPDLVNARMPSGAKRKQ